MDEITKLNFGVKLLYNEFLANQNAIPADQRQNIARLFKATARSLKEMESDLADAHKGKRATLQQLYSYHYRLLAAYVRALNRSWLNNCTACSYISNVDGSLVSAAPVVRTTVGIHNKPASAYNAVPRSSQVVEPVSFVYNLSAVQQSVYNVSEQYSAARPVAPIDCSPPYQPKPCGDNIAAILEGLPFRTPETRESRNEPVLGLGAQLTAYYESPALLMNARSPVFDSVYYSEYNYPQSRCEAVPAHNADSSAPFYISAISERTKRTMMDLMQRRAQASSSGGEHYREYSAESTFVPLFKASYYSYCKASVTTYDLCLTSNDVKAPAMQDVATNTAAIAEAASYTAESEVSSRGRHRRRSLNHSRAHSRSHSHHRSVTEKSAMDSFSLFKPTESPENTMMESRVLLEGDAPRQPNLEMQAEKPRKHKTYIQPNLASGETYVDADVLLRIINAVRTAVPQFAQSPAFPQFKRYIEDCIEQFVVFDDQQNVNYLQHGKRGTLVMEERDGLSYVRIRDCPMMRDATIVITSQRSIYRLDVRGVSCKTLICFAPNLLYCDALRCSRLKKCFFTGCTELRKARIDCTTCKVYCERGCRFVNDE